MKATLKKIQAKIDAEFPELGVEFCKGQGYFYFMGETHLTQNIDSIYIPYLNCAPLEDWLGWVVGNINEAIEIERKYG